MINAMFVINLLLLFKQQSANTKVDFIFMSLNKVTHTKWLEVIQVPSCGFDAFASLHQITLFITGFSLCLELQYEGAN